MTNQKRKQSIIAGALTGTAGIFLTKALGLLYASPFQALAGNEMIFYTSTYQIYEFLLTISQSGIPFAIATLVAKYIAKEDYKTTLMVRKISGFMLGCFGVILFAGVVLCSGQIAGYLSEGRDVIYLQKFQTSIILVSFAVIAVPILSVFRGFYQGLKEVKAYAFSQVLEQFVRVTFLLSMGALLVYVLNQAQIWAVYFAVVSTSVSAVAAIVYFLYFDKQHMPELKQLAGEQDGEGKSTIDVFKEILYFSIPYFLISIVANCSGMVSLMFVNRALQTYGYSAVEADVIYSIMNFNAFKLVSIPQILGPGFAIAIIPHITSCLAVDDFDGVRNNVAKAFTSCVYIAYPVILLMILFAKEIYFVMYGAMNLEYGASVLRWALMVSCVWIVMTLCSNTLLALKLKRFTLVWNVFSVGVLFVLVRPLVELFAYRGMYSLYACLYIAYIVLSCLLMKIKYHMEFKPMFKMMSKSLSCLLAIVVVVGMVNLIGIDWIAYGRIVTLFGVGGICVVAMIAYLICSYMLHLPQDIFGFDLKRLKGLLRR
ncbi:MAG: oligosaccharide flippase family protein [Erysipelotrichaceae bacterium]|nr:oligosaccharide flippase family protein [Erysipelotrichaceae bacterium]